MNDIISYIRLSASLFFVGAFLFMNTINAQELDNYKIYQSYEGETIGSIAKKFRTTEDEIKDLNPDISSEQVRQGKYMMIIPKQKKIGVKITHRVHILKSGETLYRISKQYDVNISDVIKLNPDLVINNIPVGTSINIPIIEKENRETRNKLKIITSDQNPKKILDHNNLYYIVQKGDTQWSVASKNKISVFDLRERNPNVSKFIKEGDTIYLREKTNLESDKLIANENNALVTKDIPIKKERKTFDYKIKRKETLFAISQKFSVPVDTIYMLNPQIQNKILKAKSIIKIPLIADPSKASSLFDEEKKEKVSAVIPTKLKMLNIKKKLSIALMMPMNLSHYKDSNLSDYKDNPNYSQLLDYSIDFYNGLRVALDSMSQKGYSFDLKVMDTQGNKYGVQKIITSNNLNEFDIIIGPFLPEGFNTLSEHMKQQNIPIISPLTTKGVISQYNTILSVPPTENLHRKIVDYIYKQYPLDSNVLLISDKERDLKKVALLKHKYYQLKEIYLSKSNQSISMEDIKSLLSFEKQNIVFTEMKKVSSLSNITSVLNIFVADTCKIVMATMEKSNIYNSDKISNYYLNKLNFTFPSINKDYQIANNNNAFYKKYKQKYLSKPNKYAIRGFDLGYDILDRYVRNSTLKNIDNEPSEQIQNKFHYLKSSKQSFYNNGFYLMQYRDMQLEIIQ